MKVKCWYPWRIWRWRNLIFILLIMSCWDFHPYNKTVYASMIMQWIRRSFPYNSWMEQEMWHPSKLSCCSKTTTLLTTICHWTKIKERMPSASFSEKKVCLLHAHASFLMKVSFTVLRHLSVWQHTTNRLNKKSTKWQQYLRIRLFHSMRSCTICKHLLKS